MQGEDVIVTGPCEVPAVEPTSLTLVPTVPRKNALRFFQHRQSISSIGGKLSI